MAGEVATLLDGRPAPALQWTHGNTNPRATNPRPASRLGPARHTESPGRGGRLADLAPAEIEELGRLYRQTTADLARARRDYPGDRLLGYLNRLVAVSYAAIYREGGWSWRRIVAFYRRDFPRLVRRQWPYIAVAAALLFVPAIAAWIAVVLQPTFAATLLPGGTYERVQGFLERHDLWTHIPAANGPTPQQPS